MAVLMLKTTYWMIFEKFLFDLVKKFNSGLHPELDPKLQVNSDLDPELRVKSDPYPELPVKSDPNPK